MYSIKVAGFSVTRAIVTVVIILAVLAAICTGVFLFLKDQKITGAQVFSNSVIKEISDSNTAASFANFDTSLKTDESAAYYSWLFWSSNFADEKITIDLPAVSSDYTNPSPDHLFGNGSVITVTYNTSSSSKLALTVIQQSDGWKILNYASV